MSIPDTKTERDEFLLTHACAIFKKCISEDAASATAKSVMINWLLLHEVAEIADRRENHEGNG